MTQVDKIIADLNELSFTERANEWASFFQKINQTERVTVVNAGLVNCGKSSMFNAIIDQEEYFPIGAVRETTASKGLMP